MKRREREKTIFFPWERRSSLWKRIGISRTRPIVFGVLFIALLLLLGYRERSVIGARLTRATIANVARGVDHYRADNEGKCPTDLRELKTLGYIKSEPVDAWDRPLRLLCPGFTHPESYDLFSDGPDGAFGGLDRIE